MNVISAKVSFLNHTLSTKESLKITQGDYNTTKLVFDFDEDVSNYRVVFKMSNPSGELIFMCDINDNEVLLGGQDEDGNPCSLFAVSGLYPFELIRYGEDSRITSAPGWLSISSLTVPEGQQPSAFGGDILVEILGAIEKLDQMEKDVQHAESSVQQMEGTVKQLESDVKKLEGTVQQTVQFAEAVVTQYVHQFENSIDELDDRLDPLEAKVHMTAHLHTTGFVDEPTSEAYAYVVANNLATGEQTRALAYNPKKLRLNKGDMVNVMISIVENGYNYTIESWSEANFVINPYLTMFKSREDLVDVYEGEKLSIKYPASGEKPSYVNMVYVLSPRQWQKMPYLRFKLNGSSKGDAAISFSMDNNPSTAKQILPQTSSMSGLATFDFKQFIGQYPNAKVYLSVIAVGGDTVYDQFYFTDLMFG